MCGIFGLATKKKSDFDSNLLKKTVDDFFKLSESRGKEASGLAVRTKKAIYVYKQPIPAHKMIKSKGYKKITNKLFNEKHITIIGHSRLATNGFQAINDNNQPVIKNNLVGIHNGIITNVNTLLEQNKEIKRKYEVDSEIILDLIQLFNKDKNKNSLIRAIQSTFEQIEGSASIALLFNNNHYLALATNTGSLYLSNEKDYLIFASEKYILEQLSEKKISHLKAGQGCLIDLDNLKIDQFCLKNENLTNSSENIQTEKVEILDLSPQDKNTGIRPISLLDSEKNLLQYNEDLNLKRCTKCILPESFPNIEFDQNGVCNFCRNHKKIKPLEKEELEKVLDNYRSNSNQPDCLMPFSGGRDSSYGLHYVKNVLKMNPVAYSYDWGMITDLARRNQARICGKLGIEHILVSADIKKKRDNIRKNVKAWLKKPDLGIIPLFMAGDKQYFYYTNEVRKKTKTKLIIYCENPLEKTDFKASFCDVKPISNQNKQIFALSLFNKINLASYYAKQFISNPSYINSSLLDTLFGYYSMYMMKHNYLLLYNYISWNEEKIISTLIDQYNWETVPDTKLTWRIGDGTAPFYNYIYHTVVGFTENDTFRSNQIRRGLISREKALELIKKENQPHYQSIKWYFEQIGIDFKEAIKTINSIPKKYE